MNSQCVISFQKNVEERSINCDNWKCDILRQQKRSLRNRGRFERQISDNHEQWVEVWQWRIPSLVRIIFLVAVRHILDHISGTQTVYHRHHHRGHGHQLSYSQSESSSESSCTAGRVMQPEVSEWVKGFRAKHTWWWKWRFYDFFWAILEKKRCITSKEEELLASPVFPALQNLPRQGSVGDSTLSARPAFGPCYILVMMVVRTKTMDMVPPSTGPQFNWSIFTPGIPSKRTSMFIYIK